MSSRPSPLAAAVVGCRMGAGHARTLADLDDYELVAVCDLDEATARSAAEKAGGAAVYTDFAAMLTEARPEVVAVATPTDSHAALTLEAVEAGAKGVYCEKPMATCLADAQRMVAVCREKGAALAVNHQRRTYAAFLTMRRLIEQGAVGEVYLVRGSCAGDVLSDGTHTIDTILHLAGDADATWVFAQIHRQEPDPAEERSAGFHVSGGWRYGHPVETGAMATVALANGWRAELLTGDLRFPGRAYQDIEVFGTQGRLWRQGDRSDPPLLILDEQGGGWRPAPLDPPAGPDGLGPAYRAFARTVREGAPHPLCGKNALRGFELVMAIYESARLRAKIELPLQQPRFPLALLLDEEGPARAGH